LDRVELRVAAVSPDSEQMGRGEEESSASVAQRVLGAVEIQRDRFRDSGIRRNARMSPSLIDQYCALSPEAKSAFHTASEKLGLSGRAYHGVLRIARTIADLEGTETVRTLHVLEAIQHRRLGDDPYDVFSEE
jgi:magnesium chelatase family protein